ISEPSSRVNLWWLSGMSPEREKGVFAHRGHRCTNFTFRAEEKSTLRRCGKESLLQRKYEVTFVVDGTSCDVAITDQLWRICVYSCIQSSVPATREQPRFAVAFLERTENDSTCIGWTRDRDHP